MDAMVQDYQRDGFVKVEGLLSRDEALSFRQSALDAADRLKDLTSGGSIFAQYVNVWTQDEPMKQLTLHPKVAEMARHLSGSSLRIWHDQILIKEPGTSKATEFHQDQPYWPHHNAPHPISCWIALGDVPVESGCMTFLPGQHHRTELTSQNLESETSLFELAPDLIYSPRVTLPLRAGDATFHHGRCPHMATPNRSNEKRVAHVVIFMPADALYSGAGHVVTDPLNLKAGDPLSGELFPLV
jgi:ectoine hydroxylase-related dioxygenase (phytanoyl-CoA dioxygenase family)